MFGKIILESPDAPTEMSEVEGSDRSVGGEVAVPKPFNAGKFIWRNGNLIETDPAQAVHLPALSQALDYARAGISGIRVTPHYRRASLLIFSLPEHLLRLEDTSRRLGLRLGFNSHQLGRAVVDVVQANAEILRGGGYLRAVIYDARQVVAPQSEGPADIVIFAGPFGDYVPAGDFRLTFDSFLRVGDQRRAKASANYIGFAAGKERARKLEMNDVVGVTAGRLGQLIIGEGTTSNFFLVLDGTIYTPPLDAGVLAGITRMRTMQLATDLGYTVKEEDILLSQVPLAEEMFLTGTASYVIPVTHFGRHRLGTEIGTRLNQTLRNVMEGRMPKYHKYHRWNTEVCLPKTGG